MSKMIIRDEKCSDFEAITEITLGAFQDLAVSRHTEQFIIHALRKAGALTISLVAEIDGQVVGHIAFSPVTMSDGTVGWYGLGPISVVPRLQRQGIGKALMREGLSRLRALGAKGCALVGDPNYYVKFGFKNAPGLIHEGIPQEVFFVLTFDSVIPRGKVEFHEAFKAEH